MCVCLRKKALEDKDEVLMKEMCWGGECHSLLPREGGGPVAPLQRGQLWLCVVSRASVLRAACGLTVTGWSSLEGDGKLSR